MHGIATEVWLQSLRQKVVTGAIVAMNILYEKGNVVPLVNNKIKENKRINTIKEKNMRMWMIDPAILCRRHLLGEHGEIHKHKHNFEKGHSIKGRKGQIEPLAMKYRHDELAEEMTKRGFNHKSPYEMPDLSMYDLDDFVVDKNKSMNDLMLRCEYCRNKNQKKELKNGP